MKTRHRCVYPTSYNNNSEDIEIEPGICSTKIISQKEDESEKVLWKVENQREDLVCEQTCHSKARVPRANSLQSKRYWMSSDTKIAS